MKMMSLGNRIMILGPSGSGKSTLAKQLGELLNLPVIHLDSLFWKPGWVESDKDDFDMKVTAAAGGGRWIIDGNYSRTLDFRVERADTIVYIDFNRYMCLLRAVKRRIQNHGRTRSDMGGDCPEKIDWEFIRWIWSFPKKKRLILLERISKHHNVYILKTRKAVRQFIKEIK